MRVSITLVLLVLGVVALMKISGGPSTHVCMAGSSEALFTNCEVRP